MIKSKIDAMIFLHWPVAMHVKLTLLTLDKNGKMCRYKKTLMAKKAAALQAFQKTDLAIPDTILEDAELRDETEFEEHHDDMSLEGKDVEEDFR